MFTPILPTPYWRQHSHLPQTTQIVWILSCVATETAMKAIALSPVRIVTDVCPFLEAWLKQANILIPASSWLQSGIASRFSLVEETLTVLSSVFTHRHLPWGNAKISNLSMRILNSSNLFTPDLKNSFQSRGTFPFLLHVCMLFGREWILLWPLSHYLHTAPHHVNARWNVKRNYPNSFPGMTGSTREVSGWRIIVLCR